MFPGGRNWDVCSLEIAAPWNTVHGRVGRPIPWGHWGETGTVYRGVRRFSPAGPALISPGQWAPGPPQLKSPIEATVLRPASSPRKTRLVKPKPARQDPMRHAWQGLPHRQVPTKGTSLWRLASSVIRAASLVSWNGTPAGESRTSCSRDPRRGGEHLSSAKQGGFPNPESGRWIWWEKEEDRDSPVFVPSTWSICDSHERSHLSAFFPRKRERHPRELTLLALLSSRQHTDCVYPQQRKFVCREEHIACNAICSRPSASITALIAIVELILSACERQTAPNKTHNIDRQTHTEWRLLNDKKLTPVPPHVLLCCLADYGTCLWRLAHLLDRLHMCSERGHAYQQLHQITCFNFKLQKFKMVGKMLFLALMAPEL